MQATRMDLFAAYALAVAFTRNNWFFFPFFQFKIKTMKKNSGKQMNESTPRIVRFAARARYCCVHLTRQNGVVQNIFPLYLHIYCTNFPNNLVKFRGYCSFLGEFLTHFFLDCPTKIRDLYSVFSRHFSSPLGKLTVTRQHQTSKLNEINNKQI